MKQDSKDPRAPQAFRLDDEGVVVEKSRKAAAQIEFTSLPQPAPPVEAPMSEANARRRSTPWGNILATTLFSLLVMWIGLWISNLIEAFFVRSMTLGWVSVALAAGAGLALLAIITREIWGLLSLRHIERLQVDSARAINQNDRAAAKSAVAELKSLYANRPDMAWALKSWAEHEADIIDPPSAMRLAERLLLEPLDESAHRIIARRARRVTLLTTVTPAAALDMILVGAQNIFMIRELAENYGGRPSFLATLRLARMVVTHLAVAGGLALSDNFLHLFVGKGILGKLSARFGEGAINGILTSRIGLAACEVCRPIARAASKRETLSSLAKELANFSSPEADKPPL
jgi:putative membrane protein